jgi:hypothetical protein
VDLFYDLAPFTKRELNVHGRNIDIQSFIGCTGLHLHFGDRSQLNGFHEFDPDQILSKATEFVQGYKALNTVQAFVLVKQPEK